MSYECIDIDLFSVSPTVIAVLRRIINSTGVDVDDDDDDDDDPGAYDHRHVSCIVYHQHLHLRGSIMKANEKERFCKNPKHAVGCVHRVSMS